MILIHDLDKNPSLGFFICSMAEKKIAVLAEDERDAANKVMLEIFENHRDENISMVMLVENAEFLENAELFRTDEILTDIGLYEQAKTMLGIFGEGCE